MGEPRRSDGSGRVYLVGGGPGDPGLLTVRAAELLASAGAVVCDHQTNPVILERCAPETEVRLLGDPADPATPSAEVVVGVLLDLVRLHPRVVRLFGSDPFLFGQGASEAQALAAAGVGFEVVPGVAAGIAAPGYAGIPVTHSGVACSLAFLSSRHSPEGREGEERWRRLAAAVDTLVVFLGGERLPDLARRLLAAGRTPDTPAAVIEWATYPRQHTVVGVLGSLAHGGEREIRLPALMVVGSAVRMRDRLAWFESRPLFGRRIVITRARAQAADFVRALEELGAEVIPFPTIRITDPPDPEPLRRAVREADRFDWIVFTSVNGVERFWAELRASGRDTRMLAGVSLCAIGPATAAAIEMEGARADLVPPEFVAESVVRSLAGEGELRGARILLPRAEVARSVLPDSLRQHGAEVVEVPAYRTVPDGDQAALVRDRLRAGEVDLVAFTASSTVRNFVELLGTDIGTTRVACIGPITAATAREAGLSVHVQAESFTIPGLVASIREHFTRPASDS